MLQAVSDLVSDIATVIAQSVVAAIGETANLKTDGAVFFLCKFVVAVVVYLTVIVGLPLLAIYGVMLIV